MKKNYIAPSMEVEEIKLEVLMGVTASGIGSGGTDDGTHTPESRRRRGRNVWDDEDEEDF